MKTRTPEDTARRIVSEVLRKARTGRRFLIAIAGPPAAGKTTVSAVVQSQLQATGYKVGLVPMDGFHMDNSDLSALGLLERKGAPETFLAREFLAAISQLKEPVSVHFPGFDRSIDQVVPGAYAVPSDVEYVLVEGNYLLYASEVWKDLSNFWDFSVFLDVPKDELSKRLVQRWIDYGLEPDVAKKRAESNDIPNAELVLGHRLRSDMTVEFPLAET